MPTSHASGLRSRMRSEKPRRKPCSRSRIRCARPRRRGCRPRRACPVRRPSRLPLLPYRSRALRLPPPRREFRRRLRQSQHPMQPRHRPNHRSRHLRRLLPCARRLRRLHRLRTNRHPMRRMFLAPHRVRRCLVRRCRARVPTRREMAPGRTGKLTLKMPRVRAATNCRRAIRPRNFRPNSKRLIPLPPAESSASALRAPKEMDAGHFLPMPHRRPRGRARRVPPLQAGRCRPARSSPRKTTARKL